MKIKYIAIQKQNREEENKVKDEKVEQINKFKSDVIKNKGGRWVRKTEEELEQELKNEAKQFIKDTIENKKELKDSFLRESNKKFTESMINIIENKNESPEQKLTLKIEEVTTDLKSTEKKAVFEDIVKKVEAYTQNKNRVNIDTNIKKRGR